MAQTIIISVVVLVFSIAIIVFNAYRLNAQVESKVAGIAALAETSLASAVWQVDHASARDFIDAVLQDPSVVYAQVITGREVMATKSKPLYAGRTFDFFNDKGEFRTRTVEIRKYGDWIGTFHLAMTTAGFHHDILINSAGTLSLALVLIVAISQTTIFFSRSRIFEPLKQLEESATSIADGQLDAPIDTRLPGELGSLARAIDDMRDSVRHLIEDLQDSKTRLEDHKNALENTVKKRTEELKGKNTSLNQALEDVQNAKKSADIANLAKSRFLASMSHEIRTPMNAILGMADILWETELTADQERYVQVFRSAGVSLLEILDDILDLSKIEAGHFSLEETGFSLSDTLDKACTVIEPKAAQKHIEFTCTLGPDVPDQLVGDPARLRQIIINLLGNAVKFTEGGQVRLVVERTPTMDGGTNLQFSVQDTGPGIPADKLDTIFDSFTQADSSTTRKYGGTGLGLAISKQLVRMMGGRIWVESSHGRGSTFLFTAHFDIPAQPLPADQPAPFADPVQLQLPKLNLLMFEDSSYNAFVIQTYLKNSDCTLTVKENGMEGVLAFKKGGYHCVIMDIQMPIMDGYEATRAIRAWEREKGLSQTPIIAMTAYALPGDAEKCLEAGANSHLPKPVKKSTLFSTLRDLTAGMFDEDEPQNTLATAGQDDLMDVKKNIVATYAALERMDIDAISSLGNDLVTQGQNMSLTAISGYGKSIQDAASNGAAPDNIRQILMMLSEYIERLSSV